MALPVSLTGALANLVAKMDTSIHQITLNIFFQVNMGRGSLTIYLDEYVRGVLHAEAFASSKSVSALIRDYMQQRLNLPRQEKEL